MKHSDIKLRGLTNYDACSDAIESIEGDFANYHGGLRRWNSGLETVLTDPAQRKIDAILRKQERDFPLCDCCGEEIKKSQVDDDGVGLCEDCAERQVVK